MIVPKIAYNLKTNLNTYFVEYQLENVVMSSSKEFAMDFFDKDSAIKFLKTIRYTHQIVCHLEIKKVKR